MSELQRPSLVHQLLAERGVDPTSEAGRLVLRMTTREARSCDDEPAARLATAVDCVLDVYRGFGAALGESLVALLARPSVAVGPHDRPRDALGSEAGRVVVDWLRQGWAPRDAAEAAARLAEAVDCGLELYQEFNRAFNAFYYADATRENYDPGSPCRGEKCVARYLRKRLGFAEDWMCEDVLNRIRERRRRCLDSFFNRYQRSLFGPRVLDRKKLQGYLVRVADFESRHVPADDPGWLGSRVKGDDLPDRPAAGPEPDPAAGGPSRYATLLDAFWSSLNGFTPAMRLEGLVSLGLGFLTDRPAVADQCRELLRAKLPRWEAVRGRLPSQRAALLRQRQEVNLLLHATTDRGERDRLRARRAEIDVKLDRLAAREARHLTRLWPRPAEVQRVLDGLVKNVGNVRFRRIGREIDLFQERVEPGAHDPRPALRALPSAVQTLLADVANHLNARPPSPSGHGLTPEEKRRREQENEHWLEGGTEVLARIRQQARTTFPEAMRTGAGWRLLCFLADLENLYELGLLTRKGVLRGFGRRHGWWLEHMLRT